MKEVLADVTKFGYIYSHWPVPSGFGKQSLDCNGIIRGLGFAIETKAPGEKPTPRQALIAEQIRRAGGKVFVIDGDTSELEEWLSDIACASSP